MVTRLSVLITSCTVGICTGVRIHIAKRSNRSIRFALCGLSMWLFARPVLAETWTDISGKYSVEAEFVGLDSGKVTLKKPDGSTVRIVLEKLCTADQMRVRRLHAGPDSVSTINATPVTGLVNQAESPRQTNSSQVSRQTDAPKSPMVGNSPSRAAPQTSGGNAGLKLDSNISDI